MSELLVPIAISSQLDVTGEERIHAAKFESIVRVSYTAGMTLSGSLPDMAVGDTIDFQYTYVPAIPPFPVTFSIVDGALPDGLEFDEDTATITGTATTAEHDNAWTVRVSPVGEGDPVDQADTAYVMDMTGLPPDGTATVPYSYTLVGTEGTAPYEFVLASGSVPTGTTLALDGEISGTPSENGNFGFSVTMTDAADVVQTKSYNIGISVDYGEIYVGSSYTVSPNVPFIEIDGNTDTITSTILFTDLMQWPVVNANNTRVYHYSSNTLRYTQLSDNTIHDLALGFNINGGPVLIDATETYIYALDFDFKRLRKVRVSDGTVMNTYVLSDNCTHMCWKDEDREIIYLAKQGFDMLEFSTLTGTETATLGGVADGTYNQYRGCAVSPTTGYVYSMPSDSGVTGYLVQFHPDGGPAGSAVALPTIGYDLAITPDGQFAYCVSNTTIGKCHIVRLSDLTIVNSLTLGNKPISVRINGMGTRAYVSCEISAEVYVIDVASQTIIDVIAVSNKPHGLTIYAPAP
jgi:hypothetical protein